MPNLSAKDLKGLLIPIPTEQQVGTIREKRVQIQKLQAEIAAIQTKIDGLLFDGWPHNLLTQTE